MIQKRRNILFVFIVMVVMLTGYGINHQLEKVIDAIELSAQTNNTADSLQSDSDAQEDENSNHVSQSGYTMEKISTSFALKYPSVLKFHFYSIWQPPKTC